MLIIFLILACRAAYVTGNGAGQTRDDEVKVKTAKPPPAPTSRTIRIHTMVGTEWFPPFKFC